MTQSTRHFLSTSIAVFLAVVFLVNAIGVWPVAAASNPGKTLANASAVTKLSLLDHIRSWFQAETETPTPTSEATTEVPTNTETVSPTIEITPTSTPEISETPTPSVTPSPSETPTASPTASPTATHTPSVEESFIDFSLSVSPEIVSSGDEVTFTVKLTNRSQATASGLLFSNTLPGEFGNGQGGFKGFHYDKKTNLLSWDGLSEDNDPIHPNSLAAGETLTLEYKVKVDSKVDQIQILDVANLTADGWSNPLDTQAVLTVASPGKHLTQIGPKGGKALGLDGKVKVEFPEEDLPSLDFISIEKFTPENPPDPNEPGVYFLVDRYTTSIQNAESSHNKSDKTVPLTLAEAIFDKPVILTVSLDGVKDLKTLPADKTPILVTQNESSGTWIRLPIEEIDKNANTVTAKVDHFSGKGITFGNTWPKDGANVVVFDSGYPNLFTGGSTFSLPIWTPPGRNGLAPSLALTYSSRSSEGVLGDIQGPWVGMGWNIDTVEVIRKITSYGGVAPNSYYGYENKFTLLFNGFGGELIPDPSISGRYHTKDENFLYIQLHNYLIGNYQWNGQNPPNKTGEWWEIVTKDGTQWRLGWNIDSEQLAAMHEYKYPATSGYWNSGYAGKAVDVITYRWRADRVTDTYGNWMDFTYSEQDRRIENYGLNYDKASYIGTIRFSGHNSPYLDPQYVVWFEVQPRYCLTMLNASSLGCPANPSMVDVPSKFYRHENWDDFMLWRIHVYYGATEVRTYEFSYSLDTEDESTSTTYKYQTIMLSKVKISGGGISLPTIDFSYDIKPNRPDQDLIDNTPSWFYPRLRTVQNGWGASITYTYEQDRIADYADHSWWNYRVNNVTIFDGISASNNLVTTYQYANPCYDNDEKGCHAVTDDTVGDLVGYGKVTEIKMAGGIQFSKIDHYFHNNVVADNHKMGREYDTQFFSSNGTLLKRTYTTFSVVSLPITNPKWYFAYTAQVDQYLENTQISKTVYTYDTGLGNSMMGNLTMEQQYGVLLYNGPLTNYRKIEYYYVYNNVSNWILGKLSQKIVTDVTSNTVVSNVQYGYDNIAVPVNGLQASLSHGSMTLSRILSTDGSTGDNYNKTIDTSYLFDEYGNQYETRTYNLNGTIGQPVPTSSDTFNSSWTLYHDSWNHPNDNLYIYPLTSINARGHRADTYYDYGKGLPIQVTDPNGLSTFTAYDGLGRTTSVTYPGYTSPNIYYSYSAQAVGGRFSLKMDIFDDSKNSNNVLNNYLAWQTNSSLQNYRPTWQIYDGLGRLIQTQEPDQVSGKLIITDTAFNTLGSIEKTGQARIPASATGGTYSIPAWGTSPLYTMTSYDELNRIKKITYPDNTYEDYYYVGLLTSHHDQNDHATVKTTDSFGRQNGAYEYTGKDPNFVTYSATSYSYLANDQLWKITDAALNVTEITYDGFGRKWKMSDPDLGGVNNQWVYTYDAFGNLKTQKDARGCTITIDYDSLNRPTAKTYSDYDCYSTPAVTYTYDDIANGNLGIGQMTMMKTTSISDPSQNTELTWFYSLDVNHHPFITQSEKVSGITKTMTTTSDAYGRPYSQVIPKADTTETLAYAYNTMGQLSGMTGTNSYAYLSNVSYSANGQVTYQKLGTSLNQRSFYKNTTQRLDVSCAYTGALADCNGSASSYLLKLSYLYENNGNISQIAEADAGRTETVTYTYDELDRLKTAGGPFNLSYSYSTIGNITQAPVSPTYQSTTYTYDTVHKHAVASLTNGNSYFYDLNGNMYCRTENGTRYNQVFDAENRLVNVQVLNSGVSCPAANTAIGSGSYSAMSKFYYDGQGNEVKREDYNAAVKTGYILYFFGSYEIRYDGNNNQLGTTLYYPTSGAMRVTTNSPVTDNLYYILSDHLGSTSVVTNTTGGELSRIGYYPFGGTRFTTGTFQMDRLYTGQQQNSYINLLNYRSRWYDSQLGRFISPDSIIPDGNPQSLNRYSYVNNEPINHNDPTGHCLGPGNVEISDGSPACGGQQYLPGYTPPPPPITPPQLTCGQGLYGTTCNNVNQAIQIIFNPNANSWQRAGASIYIGTVGSMHVALIGGTLVIIADAIIPGGIACVTNPQCQQAGYNTFSELKKAIGSPGIGNAWHHIVEQSQIIRSGFPPQLIQNVNNIIAVPQNIHAQISGYYSSIQPFTNGVIVRVWLAGQSFADQYNFGISVLQNFGVLP